MDAITFYRYTLPAPSLPDGQREGLLVRFQGISGEERWGEIAPLPNWSRETLSQALLQLKTLPPLSSTPLSTHLFPSVSFGLESVLSPTPISSSLSVPVAGFLCGMRTEILSKAQYLIEQGYTVAKIKIASLSLSEALDVVHTLRQTLRLRIDLNRAWPRAKTVAFLAHFPENSFDYIEEPVDCLEDLYTFPYPLALDESLFDLPVDALARISRLKAIVIKPTLHGNVSRWSHLIQFATTHHINVVLGGAYESGVGIARIASLAYQYGLNRIPLGLDTYSYIKQDVLDSRLVFSGGMLTLPQTLHINMHHLEAVHVN